MSEVLPGTARVPVALLDEIPDAALVLRDDHVVFANVAAQRLGVVRGSFLVVSELRRTARLVLRDGLRREVDLTLPSTDLTPTRIPAVGQVFLLGGADVGVIVEDQTEAARVEAVRRDFVANLSHEVKTPVGAISLLADALKEARDDPEAVDRFVEHIATETGRLSRLVQDLLELSRLQGGEPLPEMSAVKVDPLVDDVVERMRPLAGRKSVAVRATMDGDLMVVGDTSQLQMALSNLLDNAISYSRDGGVVNVAARRLQGVVEIAVRDEGIGIPPEDVQRIFERFYRADEARSRATGGTGLGLAIVKHVASNHGGEVTVTSAPGVGSTFTLRLPAADGQVADTAP